MLKRKLHYLYWSKKIRRLVPQDLPKKKIGICIVSWLHKMTKMAPHIGELTFPVSDVTISAATEIPFQGEQQFKGMPLDIVHYKYFLKLEHRDKEYGSVVPKEYLLEHHSKLLQSIQRYFTCEGRFGRIYQYHFRLLMHFTGKSPLNLPFYLFKSLSKMADKVQGKQSQVEPGPFHFSLTKLLVLEELNKRNQSLPSFVDSSNLVVDLPTSSLTKKETPSAVAKDIQSPTESSMKRPSATVQSTGKKKGKKLQFSPKVMDVPKKPLTRSTAKWLPLEQTFEATKTIPKDEVVDVI